MRAQSEDIQQPFSLASFLESESKPQSLKWSLELLLQVCEEASARHHTGHVLGLLSPENISLSLRNGYPRLAGLSDDDSPEVNPDSKYLHYIAPELKSGGDTSSLSDVYALGMLLQQVHFGNAGGLSLRAVLLASGEDTTTKVVKDVITKATHQIPEKRYPDVLTFQHALEDIQKTVLKEKAKDELKEQVKDQVKDLAQRALREQAKAAMKKGGAAQVKGAAGAVSQGALQGGIWVSVAAGVAAVAGLSIGAYFLLQSGQKRPEHKVVPTSRKVVAQRIQPPKAEKRPAPKRLTKPKSVENPKPKIPMRGALPKKAVPVVKRKKRPPNRVAIRNKPIRRKKARVRKYPLKKITRRKRRRKSARLCSKRHWRFIRVKPYMSRRIKVVLDKGQIERRKRGFCVAPGKLRVLVERVGYARCTFTLSSRKRKATIALQKEGFGLVFPGYCVK